MRFSSVSPLPRLDRGKNKPIKIENKKSRTQGSKTKLSPFGAVRRKVGGIEAEIFRKIHQFLSPPSLLSYCEFCYFLVQLWRSRKSFSN